MPAPEYQVANSGSVPDLTGTQVGRFSVRSRLGSGGMGEVYLADDTTLKRPVALKCMASQLRADPRYRQRFLKEAERASAFSHPHIAGIYDVLEEKGELFLVMEYVEGATLRERLRQPLRLEQFLEIALQAVDALASAHEKGIIHGDIKPENIMVGSGGQVKILDFGVAKRLPHPDDSDLTQTSDSGTGSFSGTPGYMAPEVLLNREVDGRADIFSLGVVFYEALAGRHPFRESSFVATTDRILHETPPPIVQARPRVPAELDRIVGKMLAKDPADRYATARDLLVDLRAVRRSGSDAVLLPAPAAPGLRRWAWAVVSGAAALVIFVLAAVLLWQGPIRRWLGPGSIPQQMSVVVMPFEVAAQSPETFFAAGLGEVLSAKLTRLTATHSLQVAPASEARKLSRATVEQAGKELGVNLAITGNLQRWGDDVRVTVSLVSVRGLRVLHADIVDGSWGEPMKLEDLVVAKVLDMLKLELQPPERQALAAHGTQVAPAYDSYLQGRGYLQNYDKPENIDSAIRLFSQALKLDPNYALAHAGLGEAYWKKHDIQKQAQWVDAARQSCEQALRLDAGLAAAHVCLGTLYNGTGQHEKAVAEFQRAVESEPTSDAAYRGLATGYERLNKTEEAEKTYRRAIDLRPRYWAGYSWLGAFYSGQTRYAEAANMFDQVIRLSPDNVRGYSNLGGTYILQGRYAQAIPPLERSVAIRPTGDAYNNLGTAYFRLRRFDEAALIYQKALQLDERNSIIWGNLGDSYYWAPGKRAQAVTAYQKAISLAKEKLVVNPSDAALLGNLAKYHARLEQKEPAMAYLQQALSLAPTGAELRLKAALVHHQFGDLKQTLVWLEKALDAGLSPTRLRDDPSLDDLRADKRFQALLGRQVSRQ